jgi:hypothetical protein
MDTPTDYPERTGPPSSARLTDQGWEEIDLVDPEPDWAEMPDGSFVSPDGAIRTWPGATADDL